MAKRSKEREEFLAGIIIGAVEGGTGYWACVSEYQNEGEPAEMYAVLHEGLDDDTDEEFIEGNRGGPMIAAMGLAPKYKTEGMRLDVDAVARGFQRIAEYRESGFTYAWIDRLLAANRANDPDDFDADDCDIIAQFALLGDIVYG